MSCSQTHYLVFVVLVTIFSGQSCSDRTIDLDGVIANCKNVAMSLSPHLNLQTSCEINFCPSCQFPHTCDFTCGFCDVDEPKIEVPDWWVCHPGEMLDCNGICHSVTDCMLLNIDYTSCLHWIGDGYCDDGCGGRCGRKSDQGKVLSLNCPMYDCDGRDCEQCGENPPFIPANITIPREILPINYHTTRSEVFEANDNNFQNELDNTVGLWPGLPSESAQGFPQCRDMTLWKENKIVTCNEMISDRNGLTCEDNFCDECGNTAGGCDRTCGQCSRNQSPWSTSTPNNQIFKHSTDNDDDGKITTSTPNNQIFKHSTGDDDDDGKISWVIVLTMTVSPLQGISHTRRTGSLLRLRDYSKSLYKWAGGGEVSGGGGANLSSVEGTDNTGRQKSHQGGLPWPLVVCESSGVNLSVLKDTVKRGQQDAINNGRIPRDIEFISFIQEKLGNMSRGKGVAEYFSINHALHHSKFISKRVTHVVKVTGRYYIQNLDNKLWRIKHSMRRRDLKTTGNRLLQQPTTALQSDIKNEDEISSSMLHLFDWPLIVTQSTLSPWTLFDGVIRSEVIGFNKHILSWLLEDQDEEKGRPMERLLFEKRNFLYNIFKSEGGTSENDADKAVLSFEPLLIDPTRNAENDIVAVL